MGTTYSVKVTDPPANLRLEALKAAIEDRLDALNASMSTYQSDSELSRFNARGDTGWFAVSEALAIVVAEALRVGDLTGGAFDITVGPLVNLWGFGPETRPEKVPSDEELEQALSRVGRHHLEVRTPSPALRKAIADVYVDLSAIAKGYAVDEIAQLLESMGVESYLVEIGGELRVRGLNARGEPWRIAVEVPSPGQRAIKRVIRPGAGGVATSGDYRNYFEQDGRRYSHTIDPSTGRPIDHRLASVTVVHPAAMTADALATGLMVLGPEAAFDVAQRFDLAVFLITKTDAGFVERYTRAFARYLD